jgi:hypothetical protein
MRVTKPKQFECRGWRIVRQPQAALDPLLKELPGSPGHGLAGAVSRSDFAKNTIIGNRTKTVLIDNLLCENKHMKALHVQMEAVNGCWADRLF